MKDIRPLEQTLAHNLPWNKARIKFIAFIARFLLALYAVRTVNLSVLADAFSGSAKQESNDKRLQRFLHDFNLPSAQLLRLRRQTARGSGAVPAGVGSHGLEPWSGQAQHPDALDQPSRDRLSSRVAGLAHRGQLPHPRPARPAGDLH